MYLYTLNRPQNEDEIANLECFILTGSRAKDGLTFSNRYVDVNRSAYLDTCIQILFKENDIESLYLKIADLNYNDDGYLVTLINTGMHFSFETRKSIECQISNIFTGCPNLKNPNVQFIVTNTENCWFFGKKIRKNQNRWQLFNKKPYTFCNSLPARLSRAVVNIATGENTCIQLVDPCCGMGSILLEALDMGIDAYGFDINRKVTEDANKNLCYFGFDKKVECANASELNGFYDTAVVDLPYGLLSKIGSDQYNEIIGRLRKICNRLVILSAEDITEIINKSGFEVIERCKVHKGSLDRHIVLCV